jgi:hypothetical protein
MNTALPTLEELYAAYPSFFGAESPRPWSFCVIGPTREELEALAPTMVGFLDEDSHPSGLQLPVHEGDSLRKVVEDYWEWFEDYDPLWGLCIVLPEKVTPDWPEGQRVLEPAACKTLHPTLLLADLLNNGLPGSLVALPDSALLDMDGRAQRSLMGQAVFRYHRPDLLSTGVAKPSEAQTGSKDNPRDNSSLSKNWIERGYGAGLCPRFVWAHEVEGCAEAVSVVHLSRRGDECMHYCATAKAPLATHLRRLNNKMVRDLHSNPAAIERLGRVAFGEIERADDDRFVPRWELGSSGNWGAAAEIDRDLAGFREITSTRGFELRRIDSLARIEVVHNWSPGENRPRTLWFVAEGADVLRCLRTAPCPPAKERNESDEEHRGKLDAWHSDRQEMRLFALSDADDLDYLWLVMSDDVLFENLRCRAAKSYWAPSVSAAVLAETLIPWPSMEERQRLSKIFHDSADIVEKDTLGGLIEDLQQLWIYQQDDFAPRNFNKVCVRNLSNVWGSMIDNTRELLESLEKLGVGEKLHQSRDREPESAALSSLPAPIAIARRQLANEINASRRIRASLELAQVILELDAAILLSLLRQIDSSQVSEVWKKLSLSLKHGDISLALGHKRTLAKEARRALSSSLKNMTIDPPLRDFVVAACNVKSKAWNSVVERILEFRNNNFGHGFQPLAAAEPRDADWLMQQVEALVCLVSYMESHMLVYFESRSISRQQTECVLRSLVHDNPLFPRNAMVRSRGTVMDRYNEHEVYVHVAAPDEFLSLWPWVIFQPSSQGQEAIWLFDGTKSGDAVYKSVLVPGECTTDKSAGIEVLKLL